jgi:hypothetical protein
MAPPSHADERPLAVDAASFEAEVDPPGAPGDLKADLDAFTTLDACVEAHKTMAPLVRDALEAIGYDTVVRDACHVVAAAKAVDPRGCIAIQASVLRDTCLATVAEVAGNPDECPWTVRGRPERGRDAACVAVASRDPRLCAGVPRSADQATCVAMATHDDGVCGKLGHGADRARCARAAKRWAAVFPAAAAASPFVVKGELHVDASAAGTGGSSDVDLTPDVRQGVVVLESLSGTRISIGGLSQSEPSHLGLSPEEHGRFGVELFMPRAVEARGNGTQTAGGATPNAASPARGANASLAMRVERAQVLLPGRSPWTAADSGSGLAAEWKKLERTRGGLLEIEITGQLTDGSGAHPVRAHVSTYVRDVVRPADMAEILGSGAGHGGAVGAPSLEHVILDGGDRWP